ncbi:MAG TPA: class I SAM-dependent methyltransferase [Saccharofermentans sp.]|mgnify:CR=1 FL=1|nr:class I SAM-dependent methyltransferase [Saccharofermentans sp.]HUM23280.1 class I SAM-dependent methyltransferase [Saccharofermentans sp.]
MEEYMKGNKEAWEEAFDLRSEDYCKDLVEIIRREDYAFFYKDMKKVLEKYDFKDKTLGQFCCNNGREILSLVKSSKAKEGFGFDIAENMVQFANEKAQEVGVNCKYIATSILDVDDTYKDKFDALIVTIGAMCWFKDLKDFFAIVGKCLKKGGAIIINDTHPFVNMLALDGEEGHDEKDPFKCVFSYFDHEWIGNGGMEYMVGKSYESKTFTDYTHPLSEVIGAMSANGIVITNMQELEYDISGSFEHLDNKNFPLNYILEGRKE